MNTPEDRERLVEAVVSAHRERDALGRIIPSAAFFDLDDGDRRAAFEETLRARSLEAAIDPAGLSTTAKAILSRLPR
jgi:hypothetical protein